VNDLQITAVGAAAVALVGAVVKGLQSLHGDRFRRAVDREVNAITGYQELVEDLQEQVNEVRKDCTVQIRQVRAQQERERRRMHEQHNREREQDHTRWAEERRRMHEEIEMLKAQVTAALYRPDSARTRSDDEGRR